MHQPLFENLPATAIVPQHRLPENVTRQWIRELIDFESVLKTCILKHPPRVTALELSSWRDYIDDNKDILCNIYLDQTIDFAINLNVLQIASKNIAQAVQQAVGPAVQAAVGPAVQAAMAPFVNHLYRQENRNSFVQVRSDIINYFL